MRTCVHFLCDTVLRTLLHVIKWMTFDHVHNSTLLLFKKLLKLEKQIKNIFILI